MLLLSPKLSGFYVEAIFFNIKFTGIKEASGSLMYHCINACLFTG